MEKALLGGCAFTTRMLICEENSKSEWEEHEKISWLEISLIEDIFLISNVAKMWAKKQRESSINVNRFGKCSSVSMTLGYLCFSNSA